MKKFTLEEFINKSTKIHGDKYDYSLAEYNGSFEKIKIICKKHGEFEQVANEHFRGCDCPKCAFELIASKNTKSTEYFINKAKIIHGDRYDYSETKYINSGNLVTIICPIHGSFKQKAAKHLQGSGCYECNGYIRYSNDTFIKKSKEIHGDKYDYSLVDYKNNLDKIKIICPIHGEFKQVPSSHLQGVGCFGCYGTFKYSNEEYIKKVIEKHGNKYDYSLVDYKNNSSKVKIICPKHGEFEQIAHDHLRRNNCPKCSCAISFIANSWLDFIGIPNDKEHREVKKLIPGRRFVVDGYMPEANTIYEFYGDVAHGNPKIYNLDDINPITKKPFRFAYDKTIEREVIFKEHGYNIISIWESDYKQLIANLKLNSVK